MPANFVLISLDRPDEVGQLITMILVADIKVIRYTSLTDGFQAFRLADAWHLPTRDRFAFQMYGTVLFRKDEEKRESLVSFWCKP